MAERRMFAKSIIDSDLFLDMPPTTQMFYFHLAMRADDDGFINNPKRIQRMIGASDDDMRILIAKRFILTFESGVIVIRHWKLHNYIRKDMYHPTEYQSERKMLALKNNKSPYELSSDAASDDTLRDCNGYVTGTLRDCNENVSIGKDRIGKDRLGYIAAAARTRDTTSESDCQGEDSDLSKCVKLFEDNIHPLTGMIERDELLALYDKYHGEWLGEAIKEAAVGNGRSVRYLQVVLERWERDGFKAKKEGSNGRGFAKAAGSDKGRNGRRSADYERDKWRNETSGWD